MLPTNKNYICIELSHKYIETKSYVYVYTHVRAHTYTNIL